MARFNPWATVREPLMETPGLPPIGWREWAYLPTLDIGPISAKIDTGARTSALHAYDIEVRGTVVHFKVHTIQGRDDFFIAAQAPLIEERIVKDSGGKATLRPVIRVPLKLGGQTFDAEITLIDRQDMKFRMLVGRTALSGRFLVDCQRDRLGGVPPAVRQWSQQ